MLSLIYVRKSDNIDLPITAMFVTFCSLSHSAHFGSLVFVRLIHR